MTATPSQEWTEQERLRDVIAKIDKDSATPPFAHMTPRKPATIDEIMCATRYQGVDVPEAMRAAMFGDGYLLSHQRRLLAIVAARALPEIVRQRDELARLRAENERLTGCNEDLRVTASQWEQAHATLLAEHTKQTFASRATVDALRSQLAATREGETPDGDDGGVPRFENGDPLDEAMYAEWKSSRSRVSDNGK